MGLWTLFKRLKALSVTDEKSWDPSLWRFMGQQSDAGVNVNEYTAMNYSAVFNAISLISGTIASLPLHLMQTKEKRKVRAENEPLYHVMHGDANPYMTSHTFRQTTTAHMLGWGNAYAEKVYDKVNNLIELWPITPNRVRLGMVDNVLTYFIRVDNEEKPFTRDKILHMYGLGFDGFQGYSVIQMARQSIGLGMAQEKFGALYFEKGSHPGLVVSHPGHLSEEGHKNLSNELDVKYSGLGQSHRIMLLEEAMKVEKLGYSNEDSQFLESRQFQIPEIARWFNLPPHKLKDLTRSSFNNIESEQISFLTDSILPWLVRIEQCKNSQLLSPTQRKTQKLYWKHSFEGILRSSAKDRAEFYNKMFMVGGMTINEIRDKEDMDPSDEKFADDHFVPVNMVPLSMVEKMHEKGTAKPAVEPNTGDKDNDTEPKPVQDEGAEVPG